MDVHVEEIGYGPRVVLVHGSMGYPSWRKQKPLAERFRLEIVTRPGFPPNPPQPTLDFEGDAELVADLLTDGTHLIGHSYGGVICLIAAAPRLETLPYLTVTEPPCFAIARGDPDVEGFVTSAESLHAAGPHEPRAFVASLMGIMGLAARLPDPLPAEVLKSSQVWMAERPPGRHRFLSLICAARNSPGLLCRAQRPIQRWPKSAVFLRGNWGQSEPSSRTPTTGSWIRPILTVCSRNSSPARTRR